MVEKDRQESQINFEGIYAPLKENFPTNKINTIPDGIYRAFDRVAALLGPDKRGTTRNIQGTVSLFEMWEIQISDSALRMARQKRK